mmetsp:Transcript_5629/g.11264  ORF Transcript_5629/g.11264 Transcript_5629/m.11264 type:complete len:510 (+) Transcript_5629:163-1692(+)
MLFNSTEEEVDYVCRVSTRTDYTPVCPYPFINKGWGEIIKWRGTDFDKASEITLNDCSITFGEALSKWGAFEESMFYMTLNLILALLCFQLLNALGKERKLNARNARRAGQSGCGWLGRSTITEKVCLANAIISLFHSASWIDFYGYFNLLPVYVGSALKAVCAAGFLLICAALITQWIWIMELAAIVKKRRGALFLIKWLSILGAVSEIALSVYECLVTEEEGSWDGTINVYKSLVYLVAILNIFIQSFVYLRAINKILYVRRSSGGKEGRSNDAYNAMRRYFRGMIVCCTSGVVFKLNNVVRNYGETLYLRPPCEAKYLSIVGFLFSLAQVALLWSQRSAYFNIKKRESERKSGKGGRLVGFDKGDNQIGNRISAERVSFPKVDVNNKPERQQIEVEENRSLAVPLLGTLKEESEAEKHVAFVASSPSVLGEPTLQQMSSAISSSRQVSVEEVGEEAIEDPFLRARSVSSDGSRRIPSVDLEMDEPRELGGGGGNVSETSEGGNYVV